MTEENLGKNQVEWNEEAESSPSEFLAASEACTATFWSTPVFKTFDSSEFSY